jgi:hypothetical protein
VVKHFTETAETEFLKRPLKETRAVNIILKPPIFDASMKKIFTIVSAMFLLMGSFYGAAIAQKTGYQIIVHVPAIKDSSCFLANYYGDKQYIKDTVRADGDGTVVFQGKEPLPGWHLSFCVS